MLLSPQYAALEQRCRTDTPFWAGGVVRGPDGSWRTPGPGEFQGFAKILDKRGRLVPAVAHPWQLRLDEILEGQREKGLPPRVIILKARKLGFSTWIALKILQHVTQIPYRKAIVVAQDVKTAGWILDMATLAYSHLPSEDELGFSIKPAVIGENRSLNGRKFIQFGEQSREARRHGRTGDSIFEIDTAGAPESGRGGTTHDLHLSEVAFYEGAQATRKMLSQLNAVPYELETMIALESTANGLNHFHRRWVNAVEGADDPDTGETYVPLFVGWHEDPASAITFDSVEARERFVDSIGDTRRYGEVAEDEEALIEMYGLTAEQLRWRRVMIRTQHENNVQLFKQENPASPEEAFIGSGRTVFGGVLISKAIRDAEAALEPQEGTLRVVATETRRTRGGTVEVPRQVIWAPSDAQAAAALGVAPARSGEPLLLVWEHPRAEPEVAEVPEKPPAPTAASALALLEQAAAEAAAEGAQTEVELGAGVYIVAADVAEGEVNTLSDGDYTVVHVFDHRSGMQVATHVSRIDIHDLPRWLYAVALYYNEALLAVEVTGLGIAPVDTLHKDLRYRNMYRRKKIDELRRVEEKKPGWKTDKVSKPAMIATLGEALSDGTHGIRDPRTARELTTFVYDDRGRPGAQHGEHDDRLMAWMIAKRVQETERPRKRGRARGRREPEDEITGW